MTCLLFKAAKDIPLTHGLKTEIVKTGSPIYITKGRDEKYAVWDDSQIAWDLPEEYIGEFIKVVSWS